MTIYLIAESSILLNSIHNYVKRDSNIRLVATEGFLYNYEINNNTGVLDVNIANENIYTMLLAIKAKLKPDDVVIIASDYDPAGHLIALELKDMFPNALRLSESIDKYLYDDYISAEYLLSKSDNKNFSQSLAKDFLEEKLLKNPIKNVKEKIVEYVYTNTDTNTIYIPSEYTYLIDKLIYDKGQIV